LESSLQGWQLVTTQKGMSGYVPVVRSLLWFLMAEKTSALFLRSLMGNRSGTENRRRTEQVSVRLDIDELMKISENALKAGFDSVPEYLRWLGLKGIVY
jgi:hypothetical protein